MSIKMLTLETQVASLCLFFSTQFPLVMWENIFIFREGWTFSIFMSNFLGGSFEFWNTEESNSTSQQRYDFDSRIYILIYCYTKAGWHQIQKSSLYQFLFSSFPCSPSYGCGCFKWYVWQRTHKCLPKVLFFYQPTKKLLALSTPPKPPSKQKISNLTGHNQKNYASLGKLIHLSQLFKIASDVGVIKTKRSG